jgi:hypothetical protein
MAACGFERCLVTVNKAIAEFELLENQLIEQSEWVQTKWAPPAQKAGMEKEIARLRKIIASTPLCQHCLGDPMVTKCADYCIEAQKIHAEKIQEAMRDTE